MANVPTDAALDDFYSKHGDAPGSEALAELGSTLQELSAGSYGFVPREIEAIEAAWLWPEMGWSLARFVMRLSGGRRVLVVSDVGPSEAAEEASRGRLTVETIEELLADVDELDVAVDLVIEDVPPYGSRDLAPMELLANSSKPTPEEVPMLLELHRDGIAPCRKLGLEIDGQISPALVPPLTSLYSKTDALYAKLVKREITWGEYATGNNEARATHRAEAQQVAANIKAQLDRSHREELHRNAEAWRAASETIAATRPRTTQCTGWPALRDLHDLLTP